MKILIFDTMISGHHLEYIHHLYDAFGKMKNNKFVFCIPDLFCISKLKLNWNFYDNITFKYLLEKEIDFEKCNRIKKSFLMSRLLKKCIDEVKPEKVFLISLIDFFPLLPFIISSKYSISGIIYKIYLYEWKNYTRIQKLYEILRQITISKPQCISRIYILNDNSAATYLNKLWLTNKFYYLPDPCIPVGNYNSIDIYSHYNIPNNKQIFLHMGAMEGRKGTLEILDAIKMIKNPEKYCFVFAGKIFKDISQSFYEKYNALKYKYNIVVIDEFCEYDLLANLTQICDCVLLPYKRVSLSSGIIYYAAQFNKTIIATGQGLLGKIIRKNKLGYTIKEVNAENIASAIESLTPLHINAATYLKGKTITDFQNIIKAEYD